MVICYIAQSLDGFIATKDHSLDWLPQSDPSGEDYGFKDFYSSIDGILLGRNTFEVLQRFGSWPHSDKPAQVFTHKLSTPVDKPPENVSFVTQNPQTVVSSLENQGLKRLWLVGGSQLIADFRKARLVDQYIITTIPVILGEGIPLFMESDYREFLCCVDSHRFDSGICQSTFVRI